MSIKAQRVVVGGLGAGVVLVLLDFLANGVVLAEQNRAAMEALNPLVAANMESGGFVAGIVLLDLLYGVVLVWTYAAIRSRFGAGPKTASIAAVQMWLVTGYIWTFMTLSGMFSWGNYVISAGVWLVITLIAGNVGAMLYKEEAPPPGT